METFQRQSLDRSVLENVAIGDGSAELRGRVRYDHDPVGLSDMIVAGSQGKTLRYIPDLSDPDVDFHCDLVAPLAPFGLELDQQRGILGDQSVELVLRKTDQGSFDPLYHGSAVLFSYRAGGSLEASSSFGRVTSSSAPATFATLSSDGGGFGTLSTALSNQGRIHWMSADASCGPRTFPTLLLEDDRENLIDESEDFDQWTTVSAVLTSGQNDPYGGTNAWRLEDNSTLSIGRILRDFTVKADGMGIAVFLRVGTNASTSGSRVRVTGASGSIVVDFTAVFSSGVPSQSFTIGSSFGPVDRWREGWYRLSAGTTVSISTGTATMRIDAVKTAAETGDVFVFGAQAEQ